MPKLAITGVVQDCYDAHPERRGFVFGGGRYALRLDYNERFVIIDRVSRIVMKTNALGVRDTPKPGSVVIYTENDAPYAADRFFVRLFARAYRLPNAPKVFKNFALIDEASLLALVEEYKAAHPEEWERIPREQLEDALDDIKFSRRLILGVFALAFFFSAVFSLAIVESSEKSGSFWGEPAPDTLSSLTSE